MGFGTGAARTTDTDLTTMLNAQSVSSASSSTLGNCTALDTCCAVGASIVARVTFDAASAGDVVIHVYTSHNDTNYDTLDYTEERIPVNPGNTDQKTIRIGAEVSYVKVIAENEDPGGPDHPAIVTVIGQRKITDCDM